MEITQQNSGSLNLDVSIAAFAASCSPVLPSGTNMYSPQHLEAPSKASLQKMYSVNHALHGEKSMTDMKVPKKENMFQTMFSALTNMIGEHFSRIPGSFLSNINNPLSVTLVQNEGIISHEFFRSLTRRKEPLTSDNLYNHNGQTKESLNIIEKVHNIISSDKNSDMTSTNENLSMENDFVLIENMMENFYCKDSVLKENLINSVQSVGTAGTDLTEFDFPACFNDREEEIDELSEEIYLNCAMQACSTEIYTPEVTKTDDCISVTKETRESTNSCASTESANATESTDLKPAGISEMLSDVWHKVVNGVSDRFYSRQDTVETEIPSKRSYSPKQRRKLNTVAKGRGRGRARSQLRRSGVSQTRHRKERTRNELADDIQDDYTAWRELEAHQTVQSNGSLSSFSLDESEIESPEETADLVASFTIADVKPRRHKPKTRRFTDQDASRLSTRVRYVPECATDIFQRDEKYDFQRTVYRPRLISESSVDSEDSYCIVFETESEDNCKSDEDYDETSDDQQEKDKCEFRAPTQKVKFDLKPVVHVMVQWDYAYRAARRGPWEEMARDRERFRGRINCIERVLNPILSVQHRSHVWEERFAFRE